MRSKEVEKAIDVLYHSVSNANLIGRNLTVTLSTYVLGIVLNYITELEEKIEEDKKVIENILTENNLIG